MPSTNGASESHGPLELHDVLRIGTGEGTELQFEVVGLVESEEGASYAVLHHEAGEGDEDQFIVTDLAGNLLDDQGVAEEIIEYFLGGALIRVLFLSASVGVGHSSAANAVGAELRAIEPRAQTPVVDSYDYAALVVSRIVSDGYLRMVKTIPQMYKYIYNRAERATEVGRFRAWAHQFTASNLRALMVRERPDVVVCTHAFPSGAMAEYKRTFADAPPVVAIVTDYAVHGFWIHENIDRYVVATEAMRDALWRATYAPTRLRSAASRFVASSPRAANRRPHCASGSTFRAAGRSRC